MRFLRFLIVALVCFAALTTPAHAAQIVADTASAAGNALAPIASVTNALLGLGVYAVTKIAGKGLGVVSNAVTGADKTVATKLGPILPVIAYGAAVLAPKLGINGATFAAAPVSALSAIVVNEVVNKWLAPFVKKLAGQGVA